MKVYLDTIGCRLNQAEIEALGRRLLAAGHDVVADVEGAEAVVINTCAVTADAARDARKLTRRLHRANPAADIWLTGCYATLAPEELEGLDGVHRVVLNRDKDELVRLLDPQAAESPSFDLEPVARDFLAQQSGNTRAFVKVQDGCDNRCTFCVTTVARGEGRSRHLGDVVAEVRALADAGYREAVLTGVHLGSYGHDLGNRAGLRALVAAVLERTDIPRLRLSSLEPWDLAPDFFKLWREPRLLPHLHLPLQSGSDRVLRRMARNTSRAQFRELVAAARARIPELGLSTDVITGFPGETEEEFDESLRFVEEIGFSRLHVFTYSERPGTVAAAMPDQVPIAERRERTTRMIELGRRLALGFHERLVGSARPVLWESSRPADKDRLVWSGYTPNYVRVNALSAEPLFNRVTPAALEAATPDGCLAGVIR